MSAATPDGWRGERAAIHAARAGGPAPVAADRAGAEAGHLGQRPAEDPRLASRASGGEHDVLTDECAEPFGVDLIEVGTSSRKRDSIVGHDVVPAVHQVALGHRGQRAEFGGCDGLDVNTGQPITVERRMLGRVPQDVDQRRALVLAQLGPRPRQARDLLEHGVEQWQLRQRPCASVLGCHTAINTP